MSSLFNFLRINYINSVKLVNDDRSTIFIAYGDIVF